MTNSRECSLVVGEKQYREFERLKQELVSNSNMPYRNISSKDYINKLKSGEI